MGTVYLIHFENKYYHAQHYLGYTVKLKARMKHHEAGSGSRLLRAVTQAGIAWAIVRTWDGDGNLERRLKNWKKARQLCPTCKGK